MTTGNVSVRSTSSGTDTGQCRFSKGNGKFQIGIKMAIQIKTWVTNHLKCHWRDRVVRSNYKDDSSSQWYRWIQVSVQGLNDKIKSLHYEYYQNHRKAGVVFHFEDDYASSNYLELRRYVRKATAKIPDFEWFDHQDHANTSCWLKIQHLDSEEEVIAEFERLMEILDQAIKDGLKKAPSLDLLLTSHNPTSQPQQSDIVSIFDDCESSEVSFMQTDFEKLMSLPLNIPEYQRNYCWNKDNITNLWKSLASSSGNIHLGNIILQERDGRFDIIDGQQRLITLTLFAMALGYKHPLPLLKCSLRSSASVRNIANAKYIVKSLCQQRDKTLRDMFAEHSGQSIRFGILILNKATSLDLAYTFFNSQNSKGVPLSDYDLLKAHHLQYISNTEQARHLASRWDRLLSQKPSQDSDKSVTGMDLKIAIGKHVFRLRSWKRLNNTLKTDHAIRDEYVAAPIIAAIPPFGERFSFYEKIQGGTHFFAFAENFVEQYRMFIKTDVFKALNEILSFSSHRFYKDIIETLLFGYFLKFKTLYLAEAFFAISSIIADNRYSSGQMRRKRLYEHARDSRIVMMIDQATSPTFFLAEAMCAISVNPLTLADEELRGRRLEFYNELRKGVKSILPLVTEDSIKVKISELYEY